ncbi:13112_t:CDS:10 [Entrophospora sp. SA101]|nr:13112_t:CDS:10 [Entrophospora sp. SA101]
MVRISVLNDCLNNIVNAEKRGKRQVLVRPSSKVVIKFLRVMQKHEYIDEFEVIDDHRSGKIVIQLNGRLNKCGVISPRFNTKIDDIEKWVNNLLPSRQFVLTTSAGIMDHHEARRKHTGGKILGGYPWSKRQISITNPFPRYGHSATDVTYDNDLFLFGGSSKQRLKNDVFVIEVNSLNVLAFTTSGEIPSPRIGHVHVNFRNYMIVFGGLTENQDKLDDSLYVLDTINKNWRKVSIMGQPPYGRYGHTVTVVGSKMYVFGGSYEGYYLNDLIALDLASINSPGPSWEFINFSNQPPSGRTGHISCSYNNKIYIFGGMDGSKCYNDTWCFDLQTNQWAELAYNGYVPYPRHGCGSTIIEDTIYLFGGKTFENQELGDLVAFKIGS